MEGIPGEELPLIVPVVVRSGSAFSGMRLADSIPLLIDQNLSIIIDKRESRRSIFLTPDS
jgi:hypothetical protein